MKKTLLVLTMFAFGAGTALAGEMPPGYTPPKSSGELESIKSLEGKWEGTSTEQGKDGTPAVVEYRVTSGGSAVEEKLFSGTPHEMVSMYHDTAGKLSMTHYCMLGNQPELELKSSAPGKWSLEESAASSALLSGQMRMRELVIERPDPKTLIQTWTAYGADGKAMEPTVIKLRRV